VASLGLTGVVLLATAPIFAADAATRTAAAAPTDVIAPGQPTAEVTVTVTTTPVDTAEPVVTLTTTVTPDPTVTKTKTVTPGAKKPHSVSPPPISQNPASASVPPPPPPSNDVSTTPGAEQSVTLAPASPEGTPTPGVTPTASFTEPEPNSVPIEIRNASPEYDQLSLSRKLAVPGIVLVLLVVLAVLIFQGRLQRMAHAAAIRKAGPRPSGRHRGGKDAGYEGAAGYATAQYPGQYPAGGAYAPIISFVPVQTYPYPPGQQGYVDPQAPGYPGDQAAYQGGQGYPAYQEYPTDQPYQTGSWSPSDQPWPAPAGDQPWQSPAADQPWQSPPAEQPWDPGVEAQSGEGHQEASPGDEPVSWFRPSPADGAAPADAAFPADPPPPANPSDQADATPAMFRPSPDDPERGPVVPYQDEPYRDPSYPGGTTVFPAQGDPQYGAPYPPSSGAPQAGQPVAQDPAASPAEDGKKKRRPWRRST
jgi:hypothetical protein